jgi:hypothetical protein
MTKDEAIALMSTVDGILEEAFEKRREIGGAVNWADLGCTDVAVSPISGLVTVTIEEASPGGAQELCRFVSDELMKAGYQDIYVLTEW